MKYMVTLLFLSQCGGYRFKTFAEQLNELRVTEKMKKITKEYIYDADNISQSIVNWVESSDDDESASNDTDSNDEQTIGGYAIETLYKQISELYNQFSDSVELAGSLKSSAIERNRSHNYLCKSLEALFKCSHRIRALGERDNFMFYVVDQIESICTASGGNLNDLSRRQGNSKVKMI